MKKFIVTWDAGFGDTHEVVEAENYEKAIEHAYELWKEEAESNAIYSAGPYSEELAEDLGI